MMRIRMVDGHARRRQAIGLRRQSGRCGECKHRQCEAHMPVVSSSAMRTSNLFRVQAIAALALLMGAAGASQQIDPALFDGMQWRLIGPYRSGRVSAAPANPDTGLVAAVGDRTSGAERGVFKSVDGGRTWRKVLFKEDGGGSTSIVAALDNPRAVYATLSTSAQGRGAGPGGAAGILIYRSADQGSTWTQVSAKGLPASGAGRQAIAIAAGSAGRRLFINLRAGLFRSDDRGDTWQR